MVSPERTQGITTATAATAASEPARISFSADFLDDDSFISISPGSSLDRDEICIEREIARNAADFEFLSGKNSFDGSNATMLSADELFFEGKLLPYWQINHAAEKLNKINLKSSSDKDGGGNNNKNSNAKSKDMLVKEKEKEKEKAKGDNNNNNGNGNVNVNALLGREQQEPRIWFVDDDPSPRPPKCTVLWKELLKLKKQRASTLSPSSSSSSSSSNSSSLGDAAEKEEKELSTREKHIKRIKKGLERTRSASMRIRPMVNVPICTHTGKSSSLPPLFPIRKNKIDR